MENEIIVQEKQFFREHTKRYKLDPDGLMTWGFLKFLREKNFNAAGNEIKTKIYSADFGMEAPTNAKIKTLGAVLFKLVENQDGSLRLKFLFPQIMAWYRR